MFEDSKAGPIIFIVLGLILAIGGGFYSCNFKEKFRVASTLEQKE